MLILVRACRFVPLPLALPLALLLFDDGTNPAAPAPDPAVVASPLGPETPALPAAMEGRRMDEADDEPRRELGCERLGEPGLLESGVLGSCSSLARAGEGISAGGCYVMLDGRVLFGARMDG